MMKFTDSLLLASTKLRTHKISTSVTIILASLVFSLLVVASITTTGVMHSITAFSNQGLTGRYIVSITPVINQQFLHQANRDPDFIATIKHHYSQLADEKTELAATLGITYDPYTDQPPLAKAPDGSTIIRPDINDPLLQELYKQYALTQPPQFNTTDYTQLLQQYQAIDHFTRSPKILPPASSLTVFQDGKEPFVDSSVATPPSPDQQPILSPSFEFDPATITHPFMLPNNGGWTAASKTIPIILSQDTIERVLQLPPLAANASTSQKLAHLRTIRQQASQLKIVACWRNGIGQQQLQQAMQAARNKADHADDDNYHQPSLVYGLPDATACQNPPIIHDERTEAEKTYATKQAIFNRHFHIPADPISKRLVFKVVGIAPPTGSLADNHQTRTLLEALEKLLRAGGVQQSIPLELYNQLPNKNELASIFTDPTTGYLFGQTDLRAHYAEFATAQAAEHFIDEQSCTTQSDGKCHPIGRHYQASLAFSNSAAIHDATARIQQLFGYGLLAATILATSTLWVTISRTIAASRRETAIFRAIGFKRSDISSLYLCYTLLLALLITLVTALLSTLSLLVLNHLFTPQLTAMARYSFGLLDSTIHFSLIGFDGRQLLTIIGACFAASFLGAIFPLLRNVRRNPINDLREE